MKVCAFYVTKKQRVIEEKDVTKALQYLAKTGISAVILTQISPILMEMVGTSITVQASTTEIPTASLNEGVDKILMVTDELTSALQRIAEPASYAFAVKGVLEKIAGKEQIGEKHMKEALKGYVVIQVLPMIFDMISFFR